MRLYEGGRFSPPCHFPFYPCTGSGLSLIRTALPASLFHIQISGKIHRGGVIEQPTGGSVGVGVGGWGRSCAERVELDMGDITINRNACKSI